jgi:hypothetical protein
MKVEKMYGFGVRRLCKRALIFCVLSFVAAAFAADDQKPCAIVGVATDATGASLSKARVLLVDLGDLDTQRTQVGLDGAFEYHVKPGDYAVIVAGPTDTPCWKTAIRQISIKRGMRQQLRIPLILDTTKCPDLVE